jgi:hypothetical protein
MRTLPLAPKLRAFSSFAGLVQAPCIVGEWRMKQSPYGVSVSLVACAKTKPASPRSSSANDFDTAGTVT